MKFDEILVHLGEFGFYQKRLYFLLCIPTITEAFHTLVTVFILGLPDHRCALPDLINDTYAVQDAHQEWLINRTIPADGSGYSTCQIYVNTSMDGDPINLTSQAVLTCDRWVFDRSIFQTTATEEMSLVCGDLIKRSHLNMLYQVGIMASALVLGTLADIFGRKKILCTCANMQLFLGVATVWAPGYISLCFSRVLLAFFGAAYFNIAFTMGMELVGPSKRMWTGIGIELFWVVGEFILVGLAYFIRDWRYLQLAISVPSAVYISFWWLIPESPRWLLANGRNVQAEKILQHAAKVNKVTLPDGLFDTELKEDDDHLPEVKLWQIFTHRTLLMRSFVIFLNWSVVSLVYYGLTLNSGYLYGDQYLNFFLSVVFELVAYILCLPLLDRIGRKALHVGSMLLGGIACCCTIFTYVYLPEKYQIVTTILALVGKLGASAAFAVILLFTSELFPTVIRNGGFSLCSIFARVGGIAAPYISDLGTLLPGAFGVALPLMIFGGTSIIAGLASLSLPETLNRKLPETIEDAINFGKQNTLLQSNSKSKGGALSGLSLKTIHRQDNPAALQRDEQL